MILTLYYIEPAKSANERFFGLDTDAELPFFYDIALTSQFNFRQDERANAAPSNSPHPASYDLLQLTAGRLTINTPVAIPTRLTG